MVHAAGETAGQHACEDGAVHLASEALASEGADGQHATEDSLMHASAEAALKVTTARQTGRTVAKLVHEVRAWQAEKQVKILPRQRGDADDRERRLAKRFSLLLPSACKFARLWTVLDARRLYVAGGEEES